MSYIPAWMIKPLIGLAVVALLSGTAYVAGRGHGRSAQAKEDAAAIANANRRADAAATALRAAADRLNADSKLFREIDEQTAANDEAADAAVASAQRQADGARRDAAAFLKRAAKLEQQLAAERDTCTDGRKPICGVPLR